MASAARGLPFGPRMISTPCCEDGLISATHSRGGVAAVPATGLCRQGRPVAADPCVMSGIRSPYTMSSAGRLEARREPRRRSSGTWRRPSASAAASCCRRCPTSWTSSRWRPASSWTSCARRSTSRCDRRSNPNPHPKPHLIRNRNPYRRGAAEHVLRCRRDAAARRMDFPTPKLCMEHMLPHLMTR